MPKAKSKSKSKSAKARANKASTKTNPQLPPDRLSALPLELLQMVANHFIPDRSPSEKANPDTSYRAEHKLALHTYRCAKAAFEYQPVPRFCWARMYCIPNTFSPTYPHPPPGVFPKIDDLRALVCASKTMHMMLQQLLDYEKDPLECAIAREDGALALKVLKSVKCDEERLLLLMKGAKSKTRGLVWNAMVRNGAAKRLGREWVSMMRGGWSEGSLWPSRQKWRC